MSDQFAFADIVATPTGFMVLPPVVPRSAMSSTDPTYAIVDQLLTLALRTQEGRSGMLDTAYVTAAQFRVNADFAQRVIDSMRYEASNQNRPNFLATLLAQFERRMAPSAAEREHAQGRFEQGVPEAPPLSAFQTTWDRIAAWLDTLGTVGKVGAGLAALYFVAKIVGGARR